jgi:hypothetical protein
VSCQGTRASPVGAGSPAKAAVPKNAAPPSPHPPPYPQVPRPRAVSGLKRRKRARHRK